MPELPEVETVKRILAQKITNLAIKKLDLLTPKSFQGDPQKVINQKITHFTRLGKQLSIHLSNGQIILVHLKMTGQLIFLPALPARRGGSREGLGKGFVMGHPTRDMFTQILPNKSTRIVFTFNNQSRLYFNDQRKFGWLKIVTPVEIARLQSDVGLDLLDPHFTVDYFYHQLQSSSRAIKLVLLDQHKFAGIGNIYANDALFLAQIHPLTPAKRISRLKAKRLHQEIITIINESIAHGGSTAKDNKYVLPDGSFGSHQYHFRVYQKEGESCPVCRTPIKRLSIGGRSSFYCPHCQNKI